MRILVLLLVFLASAPALPSWQSEMAVRDSLRLMPRWEQVRWLAKRGLPDPYLRTSAPVDSGPLRCVGRWSYGPSRDIDVRATEDDTILFLSRGSGVSIARFRSRDSLTIDLLADINAAALTGRVAVRDSLFCVGSGGIEFYDISDLEHPLCSGRLSLSIHDYFIRDTFCYTISRDSLAVYSVANPANPYLVGACRDSGYNLFVADSHAYVGDQHGLYVVDVSDPSAPHRVGSLGFDVLSIWVEDTLLYFGTYDSTFRSYNVANPASPQPLGTLRHIQPVDLFMPPTCDTVLYTQTFAVVSVSDPRSPRIVGSVSPPGWEYGVAALPALDFALVADYFDGLAVVDITAPQTPVLDTFIFNTGLAEDLAVDGDRLYVAGLWSGLHIIDISDPTAPRSLGNVDIPGTRPSSYAVVARDSFAFIGWTPVPQFRSVSVADPLRPELVGGYGVTNYPRDMVLSDTLVFCAELQYFQILNVARPREPVLVGSCNTQDGTYFGLAVQDTFAYLTSGWLQIVNVARPDSPSVVSTTRIGAMGVAVTDTFVYVPYGYDTLRVYSAADPRTPRLLGIAPLQTHCWDVALAESTAAVATFNGLELFSLENPSQPRWRGAVATPYGPRRVIYSAPYFYTAMWDAGVGIYAVESVGVSEGDRMTAEQPSGLSVRPNPAHEACVLAAGNRSIEQVTVRDVAGRVVMEQSMEPATERRSLWLGLSHIRSGVYFIEVDTGSKVTSIKLVKQ